MCAPGPAANQPLPPVRSARCWRRGFLFQVKCDPGSANTMSPTLSSFSFFPVSPFCCRNQWVASSRGYNRRQRLSLAKGGVIRGSDHSVRLSKGMINHKLERRNEILTAVFPSQTSRDAADIVRFLLECRNLNGVKICGVVSLCSRGACVGGGKTIGSGILALGLACDLA